MNKRHFSTDHMIIATSKQTNIKQKQEKGLS